MIFGAPLGRFPIGVLTEDLTNEGTLSASEASDGAVFSGNVSLLITGVLAASEAPDRAIFNGSAWLPITAVLSASEASDRAFFGGHVPVPITAAMAAAEAADGAAFTGFTPAVAVMSATEARDAARFLGRVGRAAAVRRVTRPRASDLDLWRSERGVDIRTVQNTSFPMIGVQIDWVLRGDGTLDDTQALATAMVVALGTDARADTGEELPDPDSTDRRGWWGDLDSEVIWQGWPIGSKLWLFRREKITGAGAFQGSTLTRIENYVREAVMPFVERRIGSQMFVEATRHGDERIDVLVRLYRGPQLEIELRYAILWADIVRSGGGYDIGGYGYVPEGW